MIHRSKSDSILQANTLLRPQGLHTLQAKLLIPIVGLMIASISLSTLAFIVGTTRTQDQLLEQQVRMDVQRVEQALTARADQVSTASALLANDPIVNAAIHLTASDALGELNDRAGAAFQAQHPQLQLDIAAGGSVVGIKAVHDGTADIGMASRPLTTQEAAGITPYQIASDFALSDQGQQLVAADGWVSVK